MRFFWETAGSQHDVLVVPLVVVAAITSCSLDAATRVNVIESNISWNEELVRVPVLIDNGTVNLEMRIYRPELEGKVPTLVFNHGSTGFGTDTNLFRQPIDFRSLATFFASRGWAVVIPARRGRAGSDGVYDEGFGPDRAAGYSCEAKYALPGADHALQDIKAAMEAIRSMPFVDANRIVMGGHSRGGVLSVAYAGMHPDEVSGVINFVGGWLGAGCVDAVTVNAMLFRRGAGYASAMLWVYGDNDPFYPLSHSAGNFSAFQQAGGKASFHSIALQPGISGHSIVSYPDSWAGLVEPYASVAVLKGP